MRPLIIKGVAIGDGMPKTIVSVMEAQREGILRKAEACVAAGADCVEWRADFAAEELGADDLAAIARAVADMLPATPLLFTLRTQGQGGQRAYSADEYATIVGTVIAADCIDMVDIELTQGDALVRELIAQAQQHRVAAVVSEHDFEGTPPDEQMMVLLEHMITLGADIPKLAVTALTSGDALRLLAVTDQLVHAHPDAVPLTIAMGPAGSITRLVGEQFGSALTFCALETASAPGQVGIARAQRVMADLHAVLAPGE